jgi:hypothetical protein
MRVIFVKIVAISTDSGVKAIEIGAISVEIQARAIEIGARLTEAEQFRSEAL